MDFDLLLKEKVDYIETIMEGCRLPEEGCCARVGAAANYSIQGGGKRLRPLIMMEVWRLWQPSAEPPGALKAYMAALELIHNYSLIHDDMPCMDNDLYRRGRKTTHAEFGEAEALLSGDCLLNLSMEKAAGAFGSSRERTGEITAPTVDMLIKALQILFYKSGMNGMLGGQSADKQSEGTDKATLELVEYIHEHKTSALIEAAMMIGGCLGGADENSLQVLEDIGRCIGLAFQIKDDILDITGSLEELGKEAGSDIKEEKTTYVSFAGLEESEKRVGELSSHGLELLAGLPGNKEFLQELLTALIHRKR